MKEEKCMSYQETAWGTDILYKLERIHTSVDPDCLFHPDDGVGYDPTGKKCFKASKKSAKKDKAKITKAVKKSKSSKKVNKAKNGKSAKNLKH